MSLQQRTGWSCAGLDVADAQHPRLDRIHRPAPRSGVERQWLWLWQKVAALWYRQPR